MLLAASIALGSVDQVEFIDGSPEAIARFNDAGIPVAVVTNQAGVARGLYGLDDVARVHQYIAERLAELGAHIDLFLYCPYHPEGVTNSSGDFFPVFVTNFLIKKKAENLRNTDFYS